MSAKLLEFWTAAELKQFVRDERHRVNGFIGPVSLVKRLPVADDVPDSEYQVVDEFSVPEVYEEPPTDALAMVGPGSIVEICLRESPFGGQVHFLEVFIAHRSGDEFIGYMAGGILDKEKKITFELKHICDVEDDGTDDT